MFSLRYRLKRTYVWFRRFFHLKGNGVHSPFAFDLMWQVISNTSHYYAYADLAVQLKAMTLRQRKEAKLLFRLTNWAQPAEVWMTAECRRYEDFVRAGSRRAAVVSVTGVKSLGEQPAQRCRRMVIADSPEAVDVVSEQCLDEGSLVVVLNIRHPRTRRQQWRALAAEPWTTLTFDLYSLGLIVIKPGYFKHHYIVNF